METCSMKGKSGNDLRGLKVLVPLNFCEATRINWAREQPAESRLEHSHGKASFAMFQPRPQDPALAPSLPFIEKFVFSLRL